MTPVERGCLYGIGLLSIVLAVTRLVEAWFDRLTERYWARKH